jgi:hypothetical protein
MTRSFLITGLPRTRTAWLSAMFTVGPVFCAHDLSFSLMRDGGVDAEELADRIELLPGCFHGSADAGTLLMLGDLRERLGNPPVLLVKRPLEHVLLSFCRVTQTTPEQSRLVLEALQARALEAEKLPGVMTVRFDELDHEQVIRMAWRHLTCDLPFPLDHFQRMRSMRVEIHPEIMFRAAHSAA